MRFERVLVTGAGGLLGRYVVEALRGRCEISGLDLVPAAEGVRHVIGSIEDPAAVARACAGVDAVVHVAARPNIWSGQGDQIIQTNAVGTWNVLEQAERAGARRAIVTSSDSAIGYTVFEGRMIPPDYLPVDSDHPLRPTDPYALSKLLCERMAESFARRGALETMALRPVYVLYPEFEAEVKARAADPEGYRGPAAGGRQPAGGGPMWHYVDPRDLARAYRLALEAEAPDFAAYFISGRTTLAPEPTVERLERRLGRKVALKRPEVYRAEPFAPLYDLEPAREKLGFLAEHDQRRLLYG